MKEEEQNAFENVDLGMFQEAAEYLQDKIEINPEDLEKKIDPETGFEIPQAKVEEDAAAAAAVKAAEESEKDKNKLPSSQEIKDSSRLTPYFKLLVEEGEFTNKDLESWDGTSAGMMDLRHQRQLAQWESYKTETLDPRTKWLQDNIEAGVSFEDLLKLDKESTNLEGINEEALTENVELQKNVARAYYKKTTRFTDDGIERTIKRLEDSGELETESKTFSKELTTISGQEKAQTLEDAKTERLKEETAQQEMLTTFKQTLDKTEEVIPGLKVNSLMRDKIYSTLTTQTGVDEFGNPLNKIAEARAKDPVNFEIKLAYLYELTNGFTDYSSLVSGGKKKAYSDFETAAREIDTKTKTGTKVNNPHTDADFLNQIEEMHKKGFFNG